MLSQNICTLNCNLIIREILLFVKSYYSWNIIIREILLFVKSYYSWNLIIREILLFAKSYYSWNCKHVRKYFRVLIWLGWLGMVDENDKAKMFSINIFFCERKRNFVCLVLFGNINNFDCAKSKNIFLWSLRKG